ncbi:MAG: hypothetical protein Q4E65_08485 [Clostridia bacterium]|nr:hypothetical protein [Clostridia bacterium]
MAEASDRTAILRQNLMDAGCSEDTAERCMTYAKNGEWRELSVVLAKHRNALLGTIHENQKKIDCLDYLIYRIGKENKEEERA